MFGYKLKIQNQIQLYKPSKVFWYATIFTLIVWILLGTLSWRHVDDYGPIESLIGNKPLIPHLKYLAHTFWGTYPPIWNFWAFPSYIFKDISIDFSRSILLIEGFISTIFSAYLTLSICLNILTENIQEVNLKVFHKALYFIEILVIGFNSLNPEIMIHSATYMPYHLSVITTQIVTLLLLSLPSSTQTINTHFQKKTLFIPYQFGLIIFSISLALSFLSLVIIVGYLATIIILYINNRKDNQWRLYDFYQSFSTGLKCFYLESKNKLLLNLLTSFIVLLGLTYIRKMYLLASRASEFQWYSGLNNIYALPSINLEPIAFLKKSIFATTSILGQSVYPFRYNQLNASIILSILIILGLIISYKNGIRGRIFVLTMFSLFFSSFIFSIFTTFVLSPTRHTIFLYPFSWVCLILLFIYIYLKSIQILPHISSNIFNLLLISIFTSQAIGLVHSHSLLQYTKVERNRLITMARNADYHINSGYSAVSGLFQSHGSAEFEALYGKECKGIPDDKNNFTIFLYSHRLPLDLENKQQRMQMDKISNGCVPIKANLTIIDKIEKYNRLGIEQNNFIYNGGSGLFGYLLKVNFENNEYKN